MKLNLVICSMLLFLAGCGNSDNKTIVPSESGKQINEMLYDNALLELSEQEINDMLFMEGQTCAGYVSTNAETEEFFICEGDEKVIKKAFEEHKNIQVESAEKYFPEDVEMIKNALLKKVNNVWVLGIGEKSGEIESVMIKK